MENQHDPSARSAASQQPTPSNEGAVNYQLHSFRPMDCSAECGSCGKLSNDPIHWIRRAGGLPSQTSSPRKHQPFEYDPVEAPKHYCTVKMTPVSVIVDWKLDYFLGQVLKYICRHEMKDSLLQDLKKARKYLDMKIELVETGELKETIKHG